MRRKKKIGDSEILKKEGHMKPETEIGVRWPQIKKHQVWWEASEASLKLSIKKKPKIMASSSITS